jgi:hydrogenase-4 membrane subunit HyfE
MDSSQDRVQFSRWPYVSMYLGTTSTIAAVAYLVALAFQVSPLATFSIIVMVVTLVLHVWWLAYIARRQVWLPVSAEEHRLRYAHRSRWRNEAATSGLSAVTAAFMVGWIAVISAHTTVNLDYTFFSQLLIARAVIMAFCGLLCLVVYRRVLRLSGVLPGADSV